MVNRNRDLDYIIDEMIDTVKKSKDEVFLISEDTRKEQENLHKELLKLREDVIVVINENEGLEKRAADARKHLSKVSKNFDKFTEEEIRKAYDEAHKVQTELTIKRDKEKLLRERRDEIELRLRSLDQLVERADGLAGKISVVLNYLNEDFRHVSDIIQDAQEKQEFGLKIIEAQEEERRRLSREMHDGPAQALANILIRSEIIERIYQKGDVDHALKEMRDIRKLIRDSLYEVRKIIYDLRPMALDDLGLIPTIKKYISTLEAQHNNIRFIYKGSPERLDTKYEVALFRLIQESIQNAIKHANATEILVKIELLKDRVTAVVVDDGNGFDPKERRDKSFGLMGMHERVEILEGKLKVSSSKEAGTKVIIVIPILSV